MGFLDLLGTLVSLGGQDKGSAGAQRTRWVVVTVLGEAGTSDLDITVKEYRTTRKEHWAHQIDVWLQQDSLVSLDSILSLSVTINLDMAAQERGPQGLGLE